VVARAISRRKGFSGLRRFDVARDLGGVADLLERAFAGELEAADRKWLQEMRAFRFLAPFLWFVSRASSTFYDPFSGFVWVEDGRIVGNVSIHKAGPGWRHRQISNMAVHPAYRRRGIARELMEAATDLIRRQGGEVVTLQVRRANTTAQNLYRGLGFTLLEGTTSLKLGWVRPVAVVPAPGFPMRPWSPKEGRKVYELARAVVPAKAQWLTPLREERFSLSLEKRLAEGLNRLTRRQDVHRWAIEEGERFVATLTVQAMGPLSTGSHRLEMMVHPDHRGLLEEALVTRALSALGPYPQRGVEAEVPADHEEAIQALKRYGFVEGKTLDWLGLELTRKERRG
jgi:ribosomal protein S18 acetylase RimI-like enzyme